MAQQKSSVFQKPDGSWLLAFWGWAKAMKIHMAFEEDLLFNLTVRVSIFKAD